MKIENLVQYIILGRGYSSRGIGGQSHRQLTSHLAVLWSGQSYSTCPGTLHLQILQHKQEHALMGAAWHVEITVKALGLLKFSY